MNQHEFDNLISSLDAIWENFTIGCGPGKFPIPVSDFSLDKRKTDIWIASHQSKYQETARLFIDEYLTHVSYKTFVSKCLMTIDKLNISINDKLHTLRKGQKLLILLNLHNVDNYKSENWVFSIMYRGLEPIGSTSDKSKRYLRNILSDLYSNYPNHIDIRLVYLDEYQPIIDDILDDPMDYLIMDCKFDDCSYSGTQLVSNLTYIANLWFQKMQQHSAYTTVNPKDLADNDGPIYIGLHPNNTLYYDEYFKTPINRLYHNHRELFENIAENFGISILQNLYDSKDSHSEISIDKYQGKTNSNLYTNLVRQGKRGYSYQGINKINKILERILKKNPKNQGKVFWNPDKISDSYCNVYRQEKVIHYYNCLCIPYISTTAQAKIDSLVAENTFFTLEQFHQQQPKNIETITNFLQKYKDEDEDDSQVSISKISNLLYGDYHQSDKLCRYYQLNPSVMKFNDNDCGYYSTVRKYINSIKSRSTIYFDHKMATFASTVPMSLVLGIVWFPNELASDTHKTPYNIPIFIGPLIKNPNNVHFSKEELGNMLRNFGTDNLLNYYFFDKFVIPPYKLKDQAERQNYIKRYNNCETIDHNHCDCLPSCQWIGETGGKKIKSSKYQNSCVNRDTWQDIIKTKK